MVDNKTREVISAFEKGVLSKEEYIGFLKGNLIINIIDIKWDGYNKEVMNEILEYCHLLDNLQSSSGISDVSLTLKDKQIKDDLWDLKNKIRNLQSNSRKIKF